MDIISDKTMAEFVYMLFFFTCRYFIKYLKCNRNSVVFIKNKYKK
uniref:Uncharacterized protein n=1 Tax=viral metagenome TaxID=1070528 RepID=A0A6C0DMA0_9ZZZZ